MEKLKKCAQVNHMTFNKSKCSVLHLGHNNPHYQYRLTDEVIKSSPAKKGLGGAGGWEAGHDQTV